MSNVQFAASSSKPSIQELASFANKAMEIGGGDDIIELGDDLGMGIEHLGMLDYRDTGELYRQCDVGIALTLSAHPSYLPLELMACGTPVVAFDNPAGDWILRDGVNSVRCRRTVDSLADAIGGLVADPARRVAMSAAASRTIAERFSSWSDTLDGVYDILADPQGWTGPARGSEFP
jgi:glycosyltransferase involved in cell wall biosynthesis